MSTPGGGVDARTERGRSVTRSGAGRIDALDGIRALAVIAVVVYHLFPSALPGGFLGVDVFFVLSGYLITRGLVLGISSGEGVGLVRFWVRRSVRLLPALMVMLVVVTAAAGLVGGAAAVRLRAQLVSALTYTSNWYQADAGLSYFERSEPPLLQHLWSLAVEEQFYLLWPVLLIAIVALTGSAWRAAVVTSGIAAASAVAMAVGFVPGEDPSRLYFGTDTHGFSLLIGAAAALVSLVRSPWVTRWIDAPVGWRREVVTAVAVVAVAGCALGTVLIGETSSFAYRGGIVLVDLAAAVAVLALAAPGPVAPLLAARPLVWLGRRSYGIYLWHWPPIVMITALAPTMSASARGALVITFTLVAAALSWIYVEQPAQRLGLGGWARSLGSHLRSGGLVPVAGAAVLVLAVGASAGALSRAPDRSEAEVYVTAGQDAINAAADVGPSEPVGPPPRPSGQNGAEPEEKHGLVDPRVPLGRQTTVIGDSVTLASATGLLDLLPGIAIDAQVGAQMWDAPDVVRRLAEAGELRPVVVVALGTNGDFDSDVLEEVMAAAGPDHAFVFVTAHGDRAWIASVNQKLRDLAEDRQAVLVADWDQAAGRVPDFADDGIHPGPQGAAVFADVLEAALRSLVRAQDPAEQAVTNGR